MVLGQLEDEAQVVLCCQSLGTGPKSTMTSSGVVKCFIQHDLLREVDTDDIQALPVGINAYGEHLIKGKRCSHSEHLQFD
jgi:hypothetical protein